MTIDFPPDAVMCAFPVGRWHYIGKPDEQGRRFIRVVFCNEEELAASTWCTEVVTGAVSAGAMMRAYEAWGA